jgi:peptidoglycan/LPS O-acetylase OafA/YrhL
VLASSNSKKSQIEALTGVRFVAAMSMAVAHGAIHIFRIEAGTTWHTYLTSLSGIGMPLFFVLSGFVIFYSYSEKLKCFSCYQASKFLINRFARLYPLYIFLISTELLLTGRFFNIFGPGSFLHYMDMMASFPYYLTLTQSWFYIQNNYFSLIYTFPEISQVAWSISTEWSFYLFFIVICPALILCRKKSLSYVLLLIWMISVLYNIAIWINLGAIDEWAQSFYTYKATSSYGFAHSLHRWLIYFSPISQIGNFVIGCIIAKIFMHTNKGPVYSGNLFRPEVIIWCLFVVFIIIYIYVFGPAPKFINNLHTNSAFTLVIAIILYFIASYDTSVSRFFASRPMVYGGECSYSIYLIHIVIMRFLPYSTGEGLESIIFGFTQLIVALFLLVILSRGMYLAIELPMQRLTRKYCYFVLDKIVEKSRSIELSLVSGRKIILFSVVLVVVATAYISNSVTKNIHVVEASYGSNCYANRGNITPLVRQKCEGLKNCTYKVDVLLYGDPASGCPKDFVAKYQCPNEKNTRIVTLPAEAGLGSLARFSCG